MTSQYQLTSSRTSLVLVYYSIQQQDRGHLKLVCMTEPTSWIIEMQSLLVHRIAAVPVKKFSCTNRNVLLHSPLFFSPSQCQRFFTKIDSTNKPTTNTPSEYTSSKLQVCRFTILHLTELSSVKWISFFFLQIKFSYVLGLHIAPTCCGAIISHQQHTNHNSRISTSSWRNSSWGLL